MGHGLQFVALDRHLRLDCENLSSLREMHAVTFFFGHL